MVNEIETKSKISSLRRTLDWIAEKIDQAAVNEDITELTVLESTYKSLMLEIEDLNNLIKPQFKLI